MSAARLAYIETGIQGAWARELGYTQFTAPVSITATTEATANTIVTASAITFDGSTTVLIKFFAPLATTDGGAAGRTLSFWLYQDGSSIGAIGALNTPAAATHSAPIPLEQTDNPGERQPYLFHPSVDERGHRVGHWRSRRCWTEPARLHLHRKSLGGVVSDRAEPFAMTDEPAFLNLVRVLPAAPQRDDEIRVLILEQYEDGVIVRWVLPGGLESAQPGPTRERPERLHNLTTLTLRDNLGTDYEDLSGMAAGSQGITLFKPAIPADAAWLEVFTRGGVTRFELQPE